MAPTTAPRWGSSFIRLCLVFSAACTSAPPAAELPRGPEPAFGPSSSVCVPDPNLVCARVEATGWDGSRYRWVPLDDLSRSAVERLDGSGAWTRVVAIETCGPLHTVGGLAIDRDGVVILAGSAQGRTQCTLRFPGGEIPLPDPYNAFLVAVRQDGALLWSYVMPHGTETWPKVATDTNGGVYYVDDARDVSIGALRAHPAAGWASFMLVRVSRAGELEWLRQPPVLEPDARGDFAYHTLELLIGDRVRIGGDVGGDTQWTPALRTSCPKPGRCSAEVVYASDGNVVEALLGESPQKNEGPGTCSAPDPSGCDPSGN